MLSLYIQRGKIGRSLRIGALTLVNFTAAGILLAANGGADIAELISNICFWNLRIGIFSPGLYIGFYFRNSDPKNKEYLGCIVIPRCGRFSLVERTGVQEISAN